MNAPRSGCPINLTLEALGDRWSLIVIRDLMSGNRQNPASNFRRLDGREFSYGRYSAGIAAREVGEVT